MVQSFLKSPSFIALLTYRLCVVFCYQITAVVVGWQVYEITHDKLALGLIGLAEVLPYFASALFAGYAVDHYNKARLGMFACVVLSLMTLILMLFSAQVLPFLNAWGTIPIYIAIALSGISRAFLSPVFHTLLVQLIKREDYARASGVGSSVFQAAQIIGPAIGGGLLALTNPSIAYATALFFACVALFAIRSIHSPTPQQHRPNIKDINQIFKSIAQGLRFVFNHQVLFAAIALDMFAVLFGGAMALLPAFVSDILHSGPESLGLLRAAPAIGAIAMGIYLTHHPINRHAGRILLAVVAGFGLSMIAFSFSTQLYLSLFFLALSGVFDSVSVILRSTIMQLSTPDEMRGRVSSISGIFISSSNELGAFESGLAASWLGLVPSVALGGCVTLLVVLITAKAAPQLRRLHISDLL